MGDTDELRAMVDAHEKSAGPPPAMAALLARMSSTAQLWAAYGGGAVQLPFDTSGNLGNVNKIVSLIQTGTLYLDLSTGVAGMAEGTSATDQEAEQLEGGLKAMIGLGRLSTSPKQPELLAAWDGLRPTREGRDVKVHIDEPEQTVDALLNLLLGGLEVGTKRVPAVERLYQQGGLRHAASGYRRLGMRHGLGANSVKQS